MEHHSKKVIDTLLFSHLYTLIKVHNIRSSRELKYFGFDKLYNPNALGDIMEYRTAFNDVSLESLNDEEKIRQELQKFIKNLRDELL